MRQTPGWRVVVAMALAVAVGAFGPPVAKTAAGVDAASPSGSASSQPVGVEHGKLSVDVRDADRAEVLKEIAGRAGFQLATTGSLGRVTASFSGVPIEEGIRRLAQDCEVMLLYQGGRSRADQRLIEVRVFAGSPPSNPARAAATIAEVSQLIRAGASPAAVARLTEVLRSAPDSSARARAAWALGGMAGPASESALMTALSDQASDVRTQVILALQRAGSVRAIPSLEGVLLRDADPSVRLTAARALAARREPSAIAALRAAATDPDPSVRRVITRALERESAAVPR